jgi:L-threonylcarbamoyladenylate synthase
MDTLLIPFSPMALEKALQLLRQGQLVAFPTDTVYGVAAAIDDEAAIERIFEAKGRDMAKAIPVLVGSAADAERVAQVMHGYARRLAEKFWPGPLTLVVAQREGLPANLSQTPTVGVRMPDHPVALAILRAAGPLAVTSANLSGGANTTTAEEVMAQLGGRIALVIDGGKTPGGQPSTVVDCTGEKPVVLREGPIDSGQLTAIS